ncbi:MAG: acyltransferase [Mucilaginibacter sp.]
MINGSNHVRIKHIDALRGIAAIIVTFFHLTGNSGLSKQTASIGKYGYTGVEIFFVISGFILPYSLQKSGYKFQNFSVFMLKRIARIYPAYIVAIIIGILITLFAHVPLLPFKSIISHLVFLNVILGYNTISPVFWTLAIEFQFYIVIGLSSKYFSSSNLGSVLLICIMILISLLISSPAYIFHWFPFFGLGILIYNSKFTGIPAWMFWLCTATIVIFVIAQYGLPEAIAGTFALLYICFVSMENKTKFNAVLLWLGVISYSLYLIHWDLGRSAVAVSRHIPLLALSEPLRLLVGFGFAVFCAYLLYLFVEKPSIKLSHKIKYNVKSQ